MKNSDNADQYKQIEQIKQLKKQANKFREKLTEFPGLEREFSFIQDDILKEYERSSVHGKHPAYLGAIREEILRKFLCSQGYLPLKYSISKSSIRIVSTTNHTSGQIDLIGSFLTLGGFFTLTQENFGIITLSNAIIMIFFGAFFGWVTLTKIGIKENKSNQK